MSEHKKALNDGLVLLSGSAFAKGMEIIKGIIVVKLLSVSDFGIYSYLKQLVAWSKHADIGLSAVVEREFNFFIANRPVKAFLRKKIGFSYEVVFSVLATLFFLVFAVYGQALVDFYLVVPCCLAFFSIRIWRVQTINLRVMKNFVLLTKVNVISSFCLLFLTVSLGSWSGLVGVVWALALSSLISNILMLFRSRFSFEFHRKLTHVPHFFWNGIKLGALGGIYGGCLFLERYIPLALHGPVILGFLSFGWFFVGLYHYLASDVARAFSPRVRKLLAGNVNYADVVRYIHAPTFVLTALALVGVFISENLLLPVVSFAFPNYLDGVEVIHHIFILVVPISIGVFSGYLLTAKGVGLFYIPHASYLANFAILMFLFHVEFFSGLDDFINLLLMLSFIQNAIFLNLVSLRLGGRILAAGNTVFAGVGTMVSLG